ncbi:MAG TPA: nitroreductase/quinone reductase family protein [Acidimicrobiales bacterium]|nr:nitroreductase/quinone reductase family protein [Acidimicrobiales bacterium]
MASDVVFRALNTAHRLVLDLSRGRLGWSAAGMPVVELTTTGRRSGRQRTTMLTSPYSEDEMIVLVASRGGDDRHPDWYLNLCAEPAVEVSVRGGPRRPMRAETAGAAERDRLWPLITSRHPNYGGYQRKTDRVIPLVLLRPVG